MNSTSAMGLPAPGDLRFASQSTGNARMAEAAREFEALMIEAMMRSMRSSVREEEAEGGFGREIYEEMMCQQLARSIAQKQGLGVARIISERLEQQKNVQPAAASPDSSAPAASSSDLHAPAGPSGNPPVAVPLNTSEPPAIPDPHSRRPLSMPVSGRISSGFGRRIDPIDGHERFHRGIDFAAPSGTPILAVDEGQVVFSGRSPQYGNVVVIEHSNKTRTLYAHLAERDVEQGDVVNRQQPIGKVGSTGRSTGPHLHFEVLDHHQNINPLTRL